LYLIKPTSKFALLDPLWIVKNSKETVTAAWGNAPVFRVPKARFEKVLRKDASLKKVCSLIDKKITILDFQHQAIEIEEEKLSHLLQQVVDEEKILKILPKTLDGFFKVCFVLNHIEKVPINCNLWLIYALSFLNQPLNSYQMFQLIYSLDFLYSNTELEKNGIKEMAKGLKRINKIVSGFSKPDGSFHSDKTLSPLDETRYSLFVINIVEDLTQDLLYYCGDNAGLNPITRIYQILPDAGKTYEFIKSPT
jgi:hypothetical protein